VARKEIDIPITGDAENRDAGKIFHIVEMPAEQGEKWALRLVFALGRSGVEIPGNIAEAGLAGIAALSLSSLLRMDFQLAEPLLDDMMRCVTIKPDTRHPDLMRPLFPEDIEEISTRLRLRSEWMNLHTGFSIADVLSILGLRRTPADETSPNTKTSPEPSGS
jgi:hypothetical protein